MITAADNRRGKCRRNKSIFRSCERSYANSTDIMPRELSLT